MILVSRTRSHWATSNSVTTLRIGSHSRLPLSHQTYSKMLFSAISQPVAIDTRKTAIPDKPPMASGYRTLALQSSEDDFNIRQKYRPFIFGDDTAEDWVNGLELTTALDISENVHQNGNERLKVLVLYGSLRKRSYSRLVAFEASRILFRLGCDVRIFDPEGLPMKNDTDHGHAKVQEIRELSKWSDGHVWVSPEQHGNLVSNSYSSTLCFKLISPVLIHFSRTFLSDCSL